MNEERIAVSCRGVVKSYVTGSTRVMALRGVDLEVRMGELLMLVGPSGCGKTTLISVIAGILDHDEGDCIVFEQDLRALGQSRKTSFRGHNVGFVFQAYNLLPTLTAAENVAVPLLILGAGRAKALGRAREMLARVGSRTRSAPCRPSFRAASSSAWPSPAPWCTSPGSSSATNRPAPSTTRPAGGSWRSCGERPCRRTAR